MHSLMSLILKCYSKINSCESFHAIAPGCGLQAISFDGTHQQRSVYPLQDFSSSWDIRATPTFFFLKDGQQLDKLVGANKPELQKKIIMLSESYKPCL